MSRRFQDIDLSRLSAPPAIEPLDYEAILAARLADFKARWEAVRVQYPDLPPDDVELLETDPVVVVEQTDSYHDMLLRGRVNDAVRAVMLATAWGGNLDHLGARVGCVRLTDEADALYRRRIQLAYEALSTAGPYGAYVWHALSAHSGVKDVAAYGPEEDFVAPGEAWISILSSSGNGSPSTQMMMSVADRLGAYEIRLPGDVSVNVWNKANAQAQLARPLTDKVIVHAAEILTYQIRGTLFVPPGPDATIVRDAAVKRLSALTADRHSIGAIVPRSLILAAAHVIDSAAQSEVDTLVLEEPAADVGGIAKTAPFCTGIDIKVEVST
jgi:phage-related baseplate assembly protein